MRGQNEPEQGSIGLGKKVEKRTYKTDPAETWTYLGNYLWINGNGRMANAPPPPPAAPAPEWFSIIHPDLDISL